MKKSLFILLVFSLLACQKDGGQPLGGAEFANIVPGNFWIYEVKSEGYSLTAKPEFLTYQLKEKIGYAISPNTYIVERSRRLNSSEPWVNIGNAWVGVSAEGIILNNGDGSKFTLKFPLKENVSWSLSQVSTPVDTKVLVKNYGNDATILGKIYTQTATIQAKNDTSLVETNRDIEIYAKNIGLISKEKTNIAYCQSTDCIGKGKPDNGIRYKQNLLSFGKE